MKRGGIYARISKADKKVPKTEIQVNICRGLAADDGATIDPRHIFIDDGIAASGREIDDTTLEGRPDALRALAAMRSGEFDILYSVEGERLARTYLDGLEWIKASTAGGVTWHLDTDGPLDPSTPAGEETAVSIFASGRREGRVRTRRQARRYSDERAAGMPLWGTRPFGYETDRISVREEEADIIRSAVRAILDDGVSMVQIAHLWNEMGVKTDGMKRERMGRDGVVRPARGYWTTTTVRQLLLRERSAGILMHKGAELPNSQIQPIISRADLEALQARIKAGTPVGRRATTLLGGILRCECGAPMHGTTSYSQRKGGPRNVYQVYKCSETAFDKTRRHASIQQPIADKYVQREALVFLAAGYVEAPSNAAVSRDRLREVERQLAGLDEQEANAEEALIMGLGKKARVLGQLERIRSERIALQDERDRLQGSSSAENLLVGFGMAFNALYDIGLPEEAAQATMQRGLNYWADLGTEKQQAILRAYFTATVKVGGRGASRITVAVRDEAASEGYRNYLIGRELAK